MATNKQVFIVYYSMYGHQAKMAAAIKEGVDSCDGVEGVLYQVAETLSEEALGKMGAPPKNAEIPVLDPNDLAKADGVLFGLATRFGMMNAQMKSFMDGTGGLWSSGALTGKPAGCFVSVGTQGGGMETTALTFVTQCTHHGMVFVPIGYSFGGEMFSVDSVHGGSAWGAGTFAGADGSRQPSDYELELARHQGKTFAATTLKLAA